VRIFENQNLQNLFDWKSRANNSLHIKSGSVLIYNNIRLCENEVTNLKKLLEGGNRADDYMARNGHRYKCKNEDIKTEYNVLSHEECEIFWTDNSSNNFPGYLIQYVAIDEFGVKEADENMLYERDSCSQYGWVNAIMKREEVTTEDGKLMKYKLENLTQYTNYAFTVQPYHYETLQLVKNNSGSEGGGPSEVKIFRTKMKRPSRVSSITTVMKAFDSITLSFDVLQNEKSAIDSFLLHVYEQKISATLIDQRDYCHDSIESEESQNSVIKTFLVDNDDDESSCCEMCCNDIKKVRTEDKFAQSLIQFSKENELRNNFLEHRVRMENLEGFYEKFNIDGNDRIYTVSDLKPFSFYRFHIYACSEKTCSEYEMHFDRTAKNEDYDRVTFRPSGGYINDTYFVNFDEPVLKNGLIVSYTLELREVMDNASNFLLSTCITRKQHELNKHT
jgi:hypothetical protein